MKELHKEVLEWFDYKDGKLFRKLKNGGLREIKTTNNCGRVVFMFKRKIYYASRMIFFYHHGWFPEMVDHIDGDVTNNRIDNLRAANNYQNQANAKLSCRNKSGVKNVYFDKSTNKWSVRLSIPPKRNRIFFGSFDDIELAELVSVMAREKYHGEFIRNA